MILLSRKGGVDLTGSDSDSDSGNEANPGAEMAASGPVR